MINLPVSFDKNFADKKIIVSCRLEAPLNIIWDAFTNPAVLDKWFAPEPYKAVTKVMEFREGGRWLYYMLSPHNEKFWSTSVFSHIRVNQSFEASDAFCDEDGVINASFPLMYWHYDFEGNSASTLVTATIAFPSEEKMRQVLEMGFEEGYKAGLNQLNQLLG